MENKNLTKVLKLKDGRDLGYAEYGDPKGYPILYFHGFPGSRYDPIMLNGDEIARKNNVRLIALDRPGLGLSDPQKGRTLLDWPRDIDEFTRSLSINEYSILGYSGGGPYALSCAFSLGTKISKVGVLCGMGPFNAPGMKDGSSSILLKPNSILRRLMIFGMRSQMSKGPEVFFSKAEFSKSDEKIMARPEVKKRLLDSIEEGMTQGPKGTYVETGVYRNDWGFKLQDISSPVYLWHGGDDGQVPISVGKYVAEKLPQCESVFLENEGHLSLPYKNFEKILIKLKK